VTPARLKPGLRHAGARTATRMTRAARIAALRPATRSLSWTAPGCPGHSPSLWLPVLVQTRGRPVQPNAKGRSGTRTRAAAAVLERCLLDLARRRPDMRGGQGSHLSAVPGRVIVGRGRPNGMVADHAQALTVASLSGLVYRRAMDALTFARSEMAAILSHVQGQKTYGQHILVRSAREIPE
jgi:hypothetical protein